ncbi:maleate cis-trans isomerase family protein [Halorubrum lacusprofundi]|jgi:Maleate cis-trans isomerase|uniref:maleate cis-trans isomerase family protein n=1 Tax=Halorubrum lacusprofundi TaxID=2247 RepID=UPI000B5A5B49|nr:aspartate/glutamate racemase family protein [Halorubrum lacusprofundi]MCG1008363.1 aspartate/glutamate racemase family protein [Halorubrum lacusprofundi]
MTRLGAVVPSSNTTAEPEFWASLPDECTFHAARMPLEDVTADELDAMADDAERAASLLSHASVDGIAYACTTGSLIHGSGFDAKLESRLSDAADAPAVATACSVVRALNALDVDRVSVATPYTKDLDRLERDYLTQNGFEVVSIDGRGLVENTAIGELDANDAEQQGRSILSNVPETDALFISCTNYRTLPALAALEKEFEIPVISSNAATIWDLCNRTGIQADLNIKLTKTE